MTAARTSVLRGVYVDSVRLMQAGREMRARDGVESATAVMGTEANQETLREEGYGHDLGDVGPDDLVLAVRAESEDAATGALEAGRAALEDDDRGGTGGERAEPTRTTEEAAAALSGANVAIVSVPGEYAALEAHEALTAGLHVLLFSDNVTVEDEVALKERAARRGRLVMGPGAGTALLGGVGLGFANVVRPGAAGLVAAAGTGAQEIMALLHRWGGGFSGVVGVGGRDLSRDVDARMTRVAVDAFHGDDGTDVLVIVSKPPHPDVARPLLRGLGRKPTVVALLGLEDEERGDAPDGVDIHATLEGAAMAAARLLGQDPGNPGEGMADVAAAALERLSESRRRLHGLFSGGTMCYETLVTASRHLGPVHSNTPLRPGWDLPADGAHVCLDLGEEEYTRGRPHPMMDFEERLAQLSAAAEDEATAVIVLDVVLGHGAHDDPAGELARSCAEVTGRDDGPVVVAYVLGTDEDPQGLEDQRARLRDAGCLLAPTAARAALLASAIVAREPGIAEAAA